MEVIGQVLVKSVSVCIYNYATGGCVESFINWLKVLKDILFNYMCIIKRKNILAILRATSYNLAKII